MRYSPCENCGATGYTVSSYSKEHGHHCNKCPTSLGTKLWIGFLCVALFFVITGPIALYGHWAYDDWTCGFKQCRVIKEIPK